LGRRVLKRRIIPVELLAHGRLVKSVAFGAYRDVGDPVKSSKVYSDQDADELLILNVIRSPDAVSLLAAQLRRIARECFVPITAGGGIRSIEDATQLFEAGADKVSVCSAAFDNLSLLEQIATRYGSQALVVCVDVLHQPDGSPGLMSNCGTLRQDIDLDTHLRRVAEAGAGEILIQSIDRDGAMTGYDLQLIERVCRATALPVIALGGAGQIVHLKNAFEQGAEAAACGSLFNFGDNNPLRAKALLKNYDVPLKKI
jgi:cyclase